MQGSFIVYIDKEGRGVNVSFEHRKDGRIIPGEFKSGIYGNHVTPKNTRDGFDAISMSFAYKKVENGLVAVIPVSVIKDAEVETLPSRMKDCVTVVIPPTGKKVITPDPPQVKIILSYDAAAKGEHVLLKPTGWHNALRKSLTLTISDDGVIKGLESLRRQEIGNPFENIRPLRNPFRFL